MIEFNSTKEGKCSEELISEKLLLEEPISKDELRRAKLRALHLLTAMDRTEAELREKLAVSYEPSVVEAAVTYVKSYDYLDDERYARNYIEYKGLTKSRRQIEQELLYKKGVSEEVVKKAFHTARMPDVTETILKFVRKRKIDPENCDYAQRQKFYAYMIRKGFQIEDLKKVFDLT